MKFRIKQILLGLALGGTSLNIQAQISAGGLPQIGGKVCSSLRSNKINSADIPVVRMPEFNLADDTVPLKSDENGYVLRCAKHFAHKFNTDIDVKEKGQLYRTDSTNIWRLGIKSDDATSLNLIFSNLNIPVGARLFLYAPDMSQILGAFTSKNNTSHKFATSILDGDEMVIQYEEPDNTNAPATLKVSSVNHGFLKLGATPAYQSSEACENNAAEDTLHIDQRQSAVLLLIDGNYYCSGNLINNTQGDGTPYVISAAHCFFEEDYNTGAYSMDTSWAQTTIAYFNYETPSAAWTIRGPQEMTLSGSRTAAYRMNRDMLLLQFDDVPPVDYRPYYAGWNRNTTISGPVFDFHHPHGDVKKVSYDEATPAAQTFNCDNLFLKHGHWMVYRWDDGITEGGSSGSALFDADNLILGSLSGGSDNISCSVPGDDDFWRLGIAWNDEKQSILNLRPCLDPYNEGAFRVSGLQPYENPCYRLTNRNSDEIPETDTTSGNFPVGTNTLGYTEFAEKFVPGKKSTLYGIYFYPEAGKFYPVDPIYVRIYNGTDHPDSLLYHERIAIRTTYFTKYGSTSTGRYSVNSEIVSEMIRNWSGVTNYFRLSDQVKVDSTFFVAFTIPTVKGDSLAIYHSAARSDSAANTAYFRNKSGEWKPFTQHPVVKAPISIMTDVVLRDGWNNYDTIRVQKPEIDTNGSSDGNEGEDDSDQFHFYPNPVTDYIYLTCPEAEELEKLVITDVNGHQCYFNDNIKQKGTFSLDVSAICHSGIYLVEATYKFETKHYKFIRIRNKTKAEN